VRFANAARPLRQSSKSSAQSKHQKQFSRLLPMPQITILYCLCGRVSKHYVHFGLAACLIYLAVRINPFPNPKTSIMHSCMTRESFSPPYADVKLRAGHEVCLANERQPFLRFTAIMHLYLQERTALRWLLLLRVCKQ
jgi:hypothetical protein